MSTDVTYICDRCGSKSRSEAGWLRGVSLPVSFHPFPDPRSLTNHGDLCGDCRNGLIQWLDAPRAQRLVTGEPS